MRTTVCLNKEEGKPIDVLTKFYGATDFVDKISFLILKQGTLFVGWYSYAYTLQ